MEAGDTKHPCEADVINDVTNDVTEEEHDVTHPYQNVTMDTNSTKDTEQMERQLNTHFFSFKNSVIVSSKTT